MSPTFTFEDYDRLRRENELKELAEKQLRRRHAEEAALRAEADRRELEVFRAEAAARSRREAAIEKERLRLVAEVQRQAFLERAELERRARVIHQQRLQQHQAYLAAVAEEQRRRQKQLEEAHQANALAEYFQCAFVGGFNKPLSPRTPAVVAEPPLLSQSRPSCFSRPLGGDRLHKSVHPAVRPVATPVPPVDGNAGTKSVASSQPVAQATRPPFEVVFLVKPEQDPPAPSWTSPPASPTAAPVPVKITPPHSSEETPDEIAEAEDAQRRYRAQLLRKHQLSRLESLAASLNAQQSAFVLPESLVFVDGEDKKLAFSPVNTGLLAYEEFLGSLLTKIDEVQSGGDKAVKNARKELVTRVETELRVIDGKRDSDWRLLKGKGRDVVAEDHKSNLQSTVTESSAPADEGAEDEGVAQPFVVEDAAPANAHGVQLADPTARPSSSPTAPSDHTLEEDHPVATTDASSSTADPAPVVDAHPVPSAAASSSASSSPRSTPLTPDALARVPNSVPEGNDTTTKVTSSDDGSHSTETLSLPDTGKVIDSVLEAAKGLGENVEKLEKEENDSEGEGFVVL